MRSRALRPVRWVSAGVVALLAAACTAPGANSSAIRGQTVDMILDRANFDVLSTHNVGRAYQEWVLLAFYTGGDDEPITKAWAELKAMSGVEGRAAQYVNVTIDKTSEWLVFPFFSRTVWTITADAIAFREGDEAGLEDEPGRSDQRRRRD